MLIVKLIIRAVPLLLPCCAQCEAVPATWCRIRIGASTGCGDSPAWIRNMWHPHAIAGAITVICKSQHCGTRRQSGPRKLNVNSRAG